MGKRKLWIVIVVIVVISVLAISLLMKVDQFFHTDSEIIGELHINSEGDYIGYIAKMTSNDNLFLLDQVEFITREDDERVKELDIDIEYEMPSGFMIYNPDSKTTEFKVNDDTRYFLLDMVDLSRHKNVTKEVFLEYNNSLSYNPLYHIFINDGYVTLIREKYIP